MRNLFTVTEMLQGVPAPTLLNLAYRSLGAYINLYPHGHPAQMSTEAHAGNSYLTVVPGVRKTCTYHQLLDDIGKNIPLAVIQDAEQETRASIQQTLQSLPPFGPTTPTNSATYFYNKKTDHLSLFWLLAYARDYDISFQAFVDNLQAPQQVPLPPHLQQAFSSAGIVLPTTNTGTTPLQLQLKVDWQKYTLLPQLEYVLSIPAAKGSKKPTPLFHFPATVKVEPSSTGRPDTGTLLLGYPANDPMSQSILFDDILVWLKAVLHNQKVAYNSVDSSALRIAIPAL